MELLLLSSFALYIIILLIIGIVASRKSVSSQPTQDSASFLLGNRSLNYWVTAISAHAADMSDWLLMGFPAVVYLYGMPQFWIAIGLLLGMFLTWHFIAPKLRHDTEKYNAYTLTSFFEHRFKEHSGILRMLSAAIISLFFTIYLAAGVKGAGLLLKSVFDINYHIGCLIGIVIVMVYTLIGGFIAAGWTELFQGLFLLLMLIITPLCAFLKVGGVEAIIFRAAQQNIPLTLLPTIDLPSIIAIIFGPLAWGLGYFGMPHVLVKFCGAKNIHEMHKSKYIGMIWQFLAVTAATAVGIVGIAYFTTALATPELIFVQMAQQLFPPFIAGFVLCGILAATLSTMDAQILVLASIVTYDFYKKSCNSAATTVQLLRIYRLAIITAATVAYLIAFNEHNTIFGLVQYAWAGLGASFGPLVLLSLYATTINKYGAIVGMLSGCITSALWRFLHISIAGQQINEILPGFIVGIITIYFVSAMTKKYTT